MDDNQLITEKQFIEDVGIAFDQTGLPRMAGRILGWLLISDPPYQSTVQICSALMASKGSISTVTRQLIQFGLIERFSLPGIRYDYFRIQSDAWHRMIKRGLEDEVKMFRQIAEQGLELLSNKPLPNRKWLENMFHIYSFMEKELPHLVERWGKEHQG